jgi:hypothetical protein
VANCDNAERIGQMNSELLFDDIEDDELQKRLVIDYFDKIYRNIDDDKAFGGLNANGDVFEEVIGLLSQLSMESAN